MVDVAMIRVRAGDGGGGVVSFRREKYVAKGGPDGGDGGDGGDVFLVGDSNFRTLDYFAGREKFEAGKGGRGRKRRQRGGDGSDVRIAVPLGCIVYMIDGFSDVVEARNAVFGLLRDSKSQLGVIHKDEENPAAKHEESLTAYSTVLAPGVVNRGGKRARRSLSGLPNQVKLQLLGEVVEDGEEMLVVKGGKGGRGNDAFKSATNRAPQEAEAGGFGEEKWLVLELKLLADVGLVGLPNVGKSTLLSVLTAARPKVADYEFTTVWPNLGVMRVGVAVKRDVGSRGGRRRSRAVVLPFATKGVEGRGSSVSWASNERDLEVLSRLSKEVVIADIPGLIEGASEGRGLGIEFLRHVERCGLLIHVLAPHLDVDRSSTSGHATSSNEADDSFVERLWNDYQTIRRELAGYGAGLENKPEVIVVNKIDLFGKDRNEGLKAKIDEVFGKRSMGDQGSSSGVLRPRVLFISAATKEGVGELRSVLIGKVR